MQIACITGASSGIGEACANQLAALGYNLILIARRNQKLIDLASKLTQQFNIQTHICVVDVRDNKQVENAILNLPSNWQNINVLINNAGLARGLGSFYNGNIDDWDQMIDTNIKGLLYVSKAIAPGMIKRQTGHIINIGSIAGKEVYDNGNVYCASKHAVDALNRSMRIELSPFNIKVSAINPGAVETEFSLVRFNGDAAKAKQVYVGFENLVANDIAETATWILTRPPHVNINDIIVMPTAQPRAGVIHKKL